MTQVGGDGGTVSQSAPVTGAAISANEWRKSLGLIVGLADRLQHQAADQAQAGIARDIATAARSLLDRIDQPARRPEADIGTRGRERAMHPLTVLVADDNRTTRTVIGKILEHAGHAVRFAKDGNAALIALRDETFDAVLMDPDMPGMNGIEATKLYRFASIGRHRIPFVALLPLGSDEWPRCLEAGMDGCVPKPIEPARLLRAIGEAVAAATTPPDLAAEDGVVPLAPHISQGAAEAPVVDMETLSNLERLGGRAFVADLVSQFSHDAGEHLRQLKAAAAEPNAHRFREIAHALRSSAANVGATRIFEMCLAVRAVTAQELSADGPGLVARLGAEIDRALTALGGQVDEAAAPSGIRAGQAS